MDVLVRLEARPSDSPVLAHVNSIPVSAPGPRFGGQSRREVITLYGEADPHSLALALAATVESGQLPHADVAVRHLGVWPDRGAVGDAAWRDEATGELQTHDLDIALPTLRERASELLGSCGPTLRQVAAGLATPDWPEGTERALSFTLRRPARPTPSVPAMALDEAGQVDGWLDTLREADALGDAYTDDAQEAPHVL